jgi:hypothetical protein
MKTIDEVELESAVLKYLDISTSHITENDGKLLREFDEFLSNASLVVEPVRFGHHVFTSNDSREDWFIEDLKTHGFSDNFIAILQAADIADCTYIYFNPDGAVLESLERFDW